MNITFKPLSEIHFPLLLQWLLTPHVRAWWDQDVQWTIELIEKKYAPYVKGHKLQDGQVKEVLPYIICADTKPIGYIQLYNFYDFPRSIPLKGFPQSLAAVDIYIGDAEYIGKNIGSAALQLFLKQYCAPKYEYAFVDPDLKNVAAIKAYTKAGFEKVNANKEAKELWMLRKTSAGDPT